MPGASAEIVHNFTGETGFVVVVPKKTTAPLADVICTIDGVVNQTRKVYPAPHGQTSMLVEDLDPVWYYFTAYRSSDGDALDEPINEIAINGATGAKGLIKRYDYVVDRGQSLVDVWADPVQDDDGLGDTRLAGAESIIIFERGTGPMLPEQYELRETGGWDWNDGKQFQNSGVYTAMVVSAITSGTSTSSSGSSGLGGVVVLSVNIDYDPTLHNNKILDVSDATVLTFPSLAALADSHAVLITHFLTGRYITLQLDPGDTVHFRGKSLNAVVLGKGEKIEWYLFNNVMYITDYDGDYANVGQFWLSSVAPLNSVPGDGFQYDQVDMPRLMQHVGDLPAGSIVAEGTGVGQWNEEKIDTDTGLHYFPQHGKYAIVGITKIRVPNLFQLYFRAANSMADEANKFQFAEVLPHTHPAGTETDPSVGSKFKKGVAHNTRIWAGGPGLINQTASTDVNKSTDVGVVSINNNPHNIKLFPFIII